MCLLAISMSYLEKCLFRSFSHSLIGLFFNRHYVKCVYQFETLFHIGISHVKWLNEIISFKGVLTRCSLLVNVLFMMSNKWFLSKEKMFKSPDTTFSDLAVVLFRFSTTVWSLQEKALPQVTPWYIQTRKIKIFSHFTLVRGNAKLLHSCTTLCKPMEYCVPDYSVHGILWVRILEWVAISFSNTWKWKVKVKSLSRVGLFPTPWTAAYRLLCPWDFPGKSTRVGCHCLLY